MENIWKKPESWEVRKIVEYGKETYTQKKKESMLYLAVAVVLFLVGILTMIHDDLYNQELLVRRVALVVGILAGMGLIEFLYLSSKKQVLSRLESAQFVMKKAMVEDKQTIHGRRGVVRQKDGSLIGNGDWLCLDCANEISGAHWYKTARTVYQNANLGRQMTMIRYDGNQKGFYGKIDVTDVLD